MSEVFLEKRKEAVLPLLEKFKRYLEKKALHLLPSGLLGEAVSYTLGQWDVLVNYLNVSKRLRITIRWRMPFVLL